MKKLSISISWKNYTFSIYHLIITFFTIYPYPLKNNTPGKKWPFMGTVPVSLQRRFTPLIWVEDRIQTSFAPNLLQYFLWPIPFTLQPHALPPYCAQKSVFLTYPNG